MTWRLAHALPLLACFVPAVKAQQPLGTGGPLPSAIRIQSVSSRSRSQLANIQQLVQNKRWRKAVEALRQCMNNRDSHRLLQVEARLGVRRHIRLQEACQWIAAHWRQTSPEPLAILRRQVNGAAKRLYQQALDTNNDRLFQQVCDEYWVSDVGDEAMLRLADKAIESGNHALARGLLLRLSPSLRSSPQAAQSFQIRPGRAWGIALRRLSKTHSIADVARDIARSQAFKSRDTYPDTNTPLAEIWSRLVWISVLAGEESRAKIELQLLAQLYPDAKGRIGSKTGNLVTLLGSLLKSSRKWSPSVRSDDWSTFAGRPSRSEITGRTFRLARRPIWSLSLPLRRSQGEYFGEDSRRVGESKSGLISYHPIAVGGRVFVMTGNSIASIQSIDLNTGKPIWRVSKASQKPPARRAVNARQRSGVARFTLTVHDGQLHARIGSSITGSKHDKATNRSRNRLVILDVASQGRLKLDPIPTPGRDWSFEGSPLVSDGVLYVALRHRQQVRSTVYVAAYDSRSGRQLWRTQIASAEAPNSGLIHEVTHCLLAMSAGRLFINTGMGAVASLRMADGRIEWLNAYARQFERSAKADAVRGHLFRDLVPCLVTNGRVIAAPPDTGEVFCFDANTGQLIWKTTPATVNDAVHVLGVANGQVILSGDYLYWLDSETGKLQCQFPSRRNTSGELAFHGPKGQGRGLLAGNDVWWPTKDNIYVFRQKTYKVNGRRVPVVVDRIPLARIGIEGGNLLLSNGVLLVTGPRQITAFNEFGRIIAP